MAKKETAIAKKVETETALAIPSELTGSWGNENIEAKDVKPERFYFAQQMSEACTSGDVKPGDIYRGSNFEILGGLKKAAEFLIIQMLKFWIIERKEGDRYVFESMKPYFPSEANLPWDFKEDGIEKRRNETFSFYCLVPSDIEKGEAVPGIISFRRTSVACAKSIISYMMTMRQFKTPSCSYVVELTTELRSNDLGKFFIPEMKKGRKATIEEVQTCKNWYDAITQGRVQVPTGPIEDTPKETNDAPQF